MTSDAKGALLVLEAGLSPGAATLDDALGLINDDGSVRRQTITPDKMDDAEWDQLLSTILAAKTVLTL